MIWCRMTSSATVLPLGRPQASTVLGSDGLPRRAFTADDVRRMTEAGILGEDDPFELIGGELIQVAAKGFKHDRVRDLLARRIIAAVDERINVSVEGTLQVGSRSLIEPDILVHRLADAAASDDGYKVVAGKRVLLAVEVAVSSMPYDRRAKAELYARHGVEEYWIVDVNGATTLVHSGPGAAGYGEIIAVPASDLLVPLSRELGGVSIRLSDLL